ncbi:MAG TPA: hypothetical protein ENJ42_06175 [Hellea balneolensis]|uniref:DUF1579 domain-containing protein n=1 Tax=Hellea balneolensis TaxID=287478 RepID=A0A7C5R826_9PROT|nr:hypothetical protein [Hellea balneolensis]
MKKIVLGAILSLSVACSGANSQETQKPKQVANAALVKLPPPPPCSEKEFRQLDFWLGDWDLEWTGSKGKVGHGRNTITKTPYKNCVISENFDGAPSLQFKGMSISTYDKARKIWRQTWVDDQGGYYALNGGPNKDGTFTLTMARPDNKGPHRRMIWSEIKKDSLVWSWQGHKDGEDEWQDLWVIHYKRRAPK